MPPRSRSRKRSRSKSPKRSKSRTRSRSPRRSKSSSSGKLVLKQPNKDVKGYCVVCKKNGVTMMNCRFKKTPRGAVMAKGHCPHCNAKMNTFMKSSFFM
mgnify:CR=1 FL=1